MLRTFAKHFLFSMSYTIDQQQLSERIFSIVKIIAVPSGLYIFLSFIILAFLYMTGFSVALGSFAELVKISDPKVLEELILTNSAEILVLNIVLSIFFHYLLSGIYGMIKSSETSAIVGLGSAYKALFSLKGLKALNVIIIIQLLSSTFSYFLDAAGFSLVGFALGILIQFLTYFVVPAIYADNQGIWNSLNFSVKTVNEKPGLLFVFMTITYLLSLAGLLFLGIGIIFTLPLNYIVSYSLYSHISVQFKN